MATDSRRLTTPPKPAFYNDPRVRSVVYQVAVVLIVVLAGAYLVSNTLENLARLGVASGFGFLHRPAGIPIGQSAIEYGETATFARALLVGFINTLIVAFIGIIVATLIGFVMGVARLSRNWLVAKIATFYVETIRNVPLLLQLLLVYAIILHTLPQPRESASLLGLVILNTGGLYLPKPVALPGFGIVLGLTILILIAIPILLRTATKRRVLTGKSFPAGKISLGLLVLIPIVYLITGRPLDFDLPQMGRFRAAGRDGGAARVRGADAGPLALYRRLHRRDRPLGHPLGQQGSVGGGGLPGAQPRPAPAPDRDPAGTCG